MRDYAKFAPSFWTRGSGKRLRGNKGAQILAAYLITAPTAEMTGIYYLPILTMVNDTGLTQHEVMDALAFLGSEGFALYDTSSELVWVHNIPRIEIGDVMQPGDRRRPKLIGELKRAGKHRFVVLFWKEYGEAFCLGRCPFDAPSMGDAAFASRTDPDPYRTDPQQGPIEGPSAAGTEIIEIQEEHAEPTKAQKLEAWERSHRDAYCQGIAEGKKGPYVWPGGRYDQGALNESVKAFGSLDGLGVKRDAERLLKWTRAAAIDFSEDMLRRPVEAKFYFAFSPKGFAKWLNEEETNKIKETA